MNKIIRVSLTLLLLTVVIAEPTWAQGILGRIQTTIDHMITILNLLLVGALAWAGFLMAKGDGTGVTRLIYCIMALVVVNSAKLIIDFFQ